MNKRQVKAAALVLLAAGASSARVEAQSTGLIPFRAKVGVNLLQNSNAKNFAGSTGFGVEGDLAIPKLLGQGRTFVSAGYFRNSDSGRTLQMIPVTLGRYFAPPNPASSLTGNVYFGAGLGPYFLRAKGGGASESKTTIGGFATVGYQFPNPYFVEAKYHLVGKVSGLNPSSLQIMAGRHF